MENMKNISIKTESIVNTINYSKNPEIQINIEMQSDAEKTNNSSANSYQYTYVINSSASPRNEIVQLDS